METTVQRIQYVNCLPGDMLTGEQRYRITWKRTLSGWTPSFIYSAPNRAQQILEWLPSVGAVPVSGITASPGDETVTFDVRPGGSRYGSTLAVLVQFLDDPPDLNLEELHRIERITYISAAENDKARNEVIKQAEKDADRNVVIDAGEAAAKSAGDAVERVYKDLRTALMVGAAILVIAIVAAAYGPNVARVMRK